MSNTEIIEELREEIRELRERVEALEQFPADLVAAFSKNHVPPVATPPGASGEGRGILQESLTVGDSPRAARPAPLLSIAERPTITAVRQSAPD